MLYERRKHWIIYFAPFHCLSGETLEEELFPRLNIPYAMLHRQSAQSDIHAFARANAPRNASHFYITIAQLPKARTGNIRVEGPLLCR